MNDPISAAILFLCDSGRHSGDGGAWLRVQLTDGRILRGYCYIPRGGVACMTDLDDGNVQAVFFAVAQVVTVTVEGGS